VKVEITSFDSILAFRPVGKDSAQCMRGLFVDGWLYGSLHAERRYAVDVAQVLVEHGFDLVRATDGADISIADEQLVVAA
jgi:hypothetical protein